MADLTQVYSALQKADAAGDTAGAKQLADYIRAQGTDTPKEPTEKPAEPQASFGERALGVAKEVGNEAVRVGAHLVTGLPLMAADAAAGVNALAHGRTHLQPGEQFPSQQYEKTLSKAFPAPTSTAGKVSEGASEIIGGAGAGAARRAAGLLTKSEAAAASVDKFKDAERLAVKTAQAAPENTKIENAKKWGFKILPTEGGGTVGKTLQGVSGKAQTEIALSKSNAVQADRLAAKAIGLTDKQPMTEGNIERLKQGAYKVYDNVKKLGRIQTDEQYRKELDAVRDRTASSAVDFPEDFNERIEKEISKFSKSSADSASFLDKIKSLRQRAGKNMSSLNADDFELGVAQKKIATAMENQIERATEASNPGLVKEFRDARMQLAKIYNVEDALSPSGHISAAILARQLKRGVPLSDELKGIAETYREFPKNMRHPDSISGGNSHFSALDYLVGGATAVAHPAAAGKVVAGIVGRPVARSIITSKAYQAKGIRPRLPDAKTHTLEDAAVGATVATPGKRHTLQDLTEADASGMVLQ